MAKFHIEWRKNPAMEPDEPSKMAKLNLWLLEMVREDLKSGKLTDWGSYCNGFSGYALMEGTEADILPSLLKYMPYIQFEVKPVVNVDQTMEAINIVVSQSKR